MNYTEQLKKRNDLIYRANKVMSIYIEIADKMFYKEAGQYAGAIKMDVDENGIGYYYHIDHYDYSAGTDNFYVSKEELENRIEKHLRKKKLKKMDVK